jgi:hypothetical protein
MARKSVFMTMSIAIHSSSLHSLGHMLPIEGSVSSPLLSTDFGSLTRGSYTCSRPRVNDPTSEDSTVGDHVPD